MKLRALFLPGLVLLSAGAFLGSHRDKHAAAVPLPSLAPPAQTETATFGAGCFWATEAAFRGLPGVVTTQVGFMGGKLPQPTYRQVEHGHTGHTEVAQVVFDPTRTTYSQLLAVFWKCHDPTEPNAKRPEIGEQYRSAIFVANPAQEKAAHTSLKYLARTHHFPAQIQTRILPAKPFYVADEQHQHYYEKHPGFKGCPL